MSLRKEKPPARVIQQGSSLRSASWRLLMLEPTASGGGTAQQMTDDQINRLFWREGWRRQDGFEQLAHIRRRERGQQLDFQLRRQLWIARSQMLPVEFSLRHEPERQ